MLSDSQIEKLMKLACDTCGCPELYNHIGYSWSNRLRTTMGQARYSTVGPSNMPVLRRYKFDLQFSRYVFSHSDARACAENVIHETCHVIDWYQRFTHTNKYGGGPHGDNWRYLMLQCGVQPNRVHKNPVKKNKTYTAKCRCGSYQISGHRMSKIVYKGTGYQCLKCNTRLVVDISEVDRYIGK